ncbi:MAG: outer membrane lipoprotein-sorting protein [Bacteroidia bacterium]|nr:outer membrane lipoprotein-sorting protein [Bacteroidia bacterium]
MKQSILLLFALSMSAFLLFALSMSASAAPNATALVKKASLLLRGEVSSNHHISFVVHRPGIEKKREMIVCLKGNDYSFGHIISPLRDRNITFLRRNHDMWTYIPKVSKAIRIPFAMMHEGVLGSDFTYEDLFKAYTLTDDYSHKILGLSKAMSKKHGRVYIVELLPLPGHRAVHKKLRLWIKEKPNPMILRQQFYNDKLEVVRVLVFSEIRKYGDRNLPQMWKMNDLTKKGYYTVYKIINASYNDIESAEMFAEKSLASPPKPIWKK